jgi:hypothetical protein
VKKVLIIIASLCAVAAVFLYQGEIINFTFKLLGKSQEPPVKAIAFLNDINKNVTYKRSTSVGWGIGENNLGLAILDSVSTGAYSTALVKFNIGYLFNLDENSLVVIEEPKQPLANLTEVSFHQGTFQATNETAADATLVVRSNKTTTEVKGKFNFGMSVDKVNKKAKIWVKIGQAKVTDDKGNQMIINENEEKDFSTEDIAPPPPEVKPEPIPEPTPEPEPVKKAKMKRINTNEIRRIIAGQRQKIDTCYTRSRRLGGGTITASITINNTGKVANSSVIKSTFDDPNIETCVAFWMRAIKFPKFQGTPITEKVDIIFR